MTTHLPTGIVSVLQTPFDSQGDVAWGDLERLVERGIECGVDGYLAPVVASEVDVLTPHERVGILELVARLSRGRVPFIVGASSGDVSVCIEHARHAERVGATAYLVAVPDALYAEPPAIVSFFREVAAGSELPLVMQDLQFGGPGMGIDTIRRVVGSAPTVAGFKVETVPAGPKYSAVREAVTDCSGGDIWIAGGWAVPQMIEALDRGVDAMIPESSMIPVYRAVDRAHRRGNRDSALATFRRLLPVNTFTNQDLLTSIAFFKRLLVRKGIFGTDALRKPGHAWDRYSERIADELIEYYADLEAEVVATGR